MNTRPAVRRRFPSRLSELALIVALTAAPVAPAVAASITLAGTMQGRAMLIVDGVTRSYQVGQTITSGVRLLEVESGQAVIESNGRRQTLAVGQRALGSATAVETAVLHANPQGHYIADGTINGLPVRFLVDTGATMVSLGMSEARRLGLDKLAGQSGFSQTAAGAAPVTRVRLERVSLGDINLDGVDALIHGNDLPVTLLGMSFLNRTDMKVEGSLLKLKRRY